MSMKYRYWFHRERDGAARTYLGWRGEGHSPLASPRVEGGRNAARATAQRIANETGEAIVVKRQEGMKPSEPIFTVQPESAGITP